MIMHSTQLTDEQVALAPFYREKWQSIAASIEPINKEICGELVKRLYEKLKARQPEVIFFQSPHEALKSHSEFTQHISMYYPEFSDFENIILDEIHENFTFALDVWQKIEVLRNNHDMGQWSGVTYSITEQLKSDFKKLSEMTCRSWLYPPHDIANSICRRDFLVSVLNLNIPLMDSWEILKSLNEQMGWYDPRTELCIVCDRPRIMNFDENKKLHMDGAPAVEYTDGFSVYAFHGTVLPKKYGEISSNEWNPQWLLEKTSDKMRRTLLSGMSFEAIQETLKLKEVDTWKKYRLWEVENETKGKPIVLLTKETDQGIVTDSVAARLRKAKKAVEWLHLRYCQEDIFDGD
jgi:hypothetical protein